MASRVTPPTEEEGAEVDGVEEAGGVAVSICGRFGWSWASLHLTIAASNGIHDREVWRLKVGDRHMAKNPRDSKRENELIMGRRILIDIYKGEYEVRGKVYSKPLKEG